jgi:hypothetical protein
MPFSKKSLLTNNDPSFEKVGQEKPRFSGAFLVRRQAAICAPPLELNSPQAHRLPGKSAA